MQREPLRNVAGNTPAEYSKGTLPAIRILENKIQEEVKHKRKCYDKNTEAISCESLEHISRRTYL